MVITVTVDTAAEAGDAVAMTTSDDVLIDVRLTPSIDPLCGKWRLLSVVMDIKEGLQRYELMTLTGK